MDIDNLTLPDNVAEPSETTIETVNEWVWHNSELCNNCFTRVRAIGDIYEKQLEISPNRSLDENPPLKMRTNEYYERTEQGSQEHDPFLPAGNRFGTCFCLECGADTNRENRTLSLEETQTRLKRVCEYIGTYTPHTVDPATVGRTLAKLRSVDENHGYDSEIITLSLAAGLSAISESESRKTEDTGGEQYGN